MGFVSVFGKVVTMFNGRKEVSSLYRWVLRERKSVRMCERERWSVRGVNGWFDWAEAKSAALPGAVGQGVTWHALKQNDKRRRR